MFVQSLGAALQNILLAAFERGIVGYLKGAPLFCADAVREALDLPGDWHPGFLVLLGYPAPGARPSERPQLKLEEFLVER
jgi:nitroreductase